RCLAYQVSTQVVEFLIERALVCVAVATNGIYLRFLDVSVHHATGIERPYDVEKFHTIIPHLFPSPLAHRARCDTIDLEFQSITVPLIVSLKQLGCSL